LSDRKRFTVPVSWTTNDTSLELFGVLCYLISKPGAKLISDKELACRFKLNVLEVQDILRQGTELGYLKFLGGYWQFNRDSEYFDSLPAVDPYSELFEVLYEQSYGLPYPRKQADYVQLARTRKQYTQQLTVADWQLACTHYFESPLGCHTLADLATRYPTFRRYALDRFGKPDASAQPRKESNNERKWRETHELLSRLNTGEPDTRGLLVPGAPSDRGE